MITTVRFITMVMMISVILKNNEKNTMVIMIKDVETITRMKILMIMKIITKYMVRQTIMITEY